MATVLPFAGMRPPAGLAAQVAAPPYDVVTSARARELARGNPHSFLHINKPEIDCDPDCDPHADAVYAQGAENIRRFIAEGILVRDPAPCFYLYRQELGGHCQTGIVALVSVADYEAGVIRRHELTRPDKENDRVRHMQAVACQTGPVFLAYRGEPAIDTLMAELADTAPVNDFTSDGVRHRFWVLADPAVRDTVGRLFAAVPAFYVADGHHRSAAAVRYCNLQHAQQPGKVDAPWRHFMAVLFPHDQLNILGYHRVVRDLGAHSPAQFLAALAADFIVTALEDADDPMPGAPYRFGLYLDGRWYRLDPKAAAGIPADAVAALDVSVLQARILAPLLGIMDPRTDPRLDFVGGIHGREGLEQAVDSGVYAAAFACYPVTIEQLMAIADAGRLMPPKSTWFEPKIKSGLVIHKLD